MSQAPSWLSPKIIGYLLGLLLLASVVAGLAGCNLGDFVQAKTPISIQKTEGLPSRLSVNDSRTEYEKWLAGVQSDAAQWRGSIEASEELIGLLNNLAMAGFNEIGPSIAGLPVGGGA